MTNYNERLAEQLNYLMEYSYKYGKGEIPLNEDPPLIIARGAKQSITSLTKELVAEAKPHKRLPDDSPTADEDLVNYGYNQAINQFEQNLLKALSSSGKE